MAGLVRAILLVALAGAAAAVPSASASTHFNTTTNSTTLLYVPFHSSEPTSNLRDLIDCALSPAVAPSVAGEQFDILLALSGAAADPRRADQLGALLRTAAAKLPVPLPRVHVTSVALGPGHDAYDRDAVGTRDWVSGPNSLFYDTFLPNGTVHRRHVAGYTYVQQLETDVCATRRGWLDTLLAAARARPSALVVGANLAGDCVWVAAHEECEPVRDRGDDGVLVGHVNGNALFRVTEDLARLLTLARDALGDSEPFDLALWRAAVAVGWEGRVVGTPAAVNVGAPVDKARFRQAAYHGRPSEAVLVHAPRRLRTDGVAAAAARIAAGRVATVVVVTRNDVASGLLRHIAASLAGAGVTDVLYAAADDASYDAASKLAPYRVVSGGAAAVAAKLSAREVPIFMTPCRSAVLDGTAYARALTAIAGMAGVSGGGCGALVDALPVFIPPWPRAVPVAVATWANASHAATLASVLSAARVPCRPLPPRLFADIRTAANWTADPPFLHASRLSRRAAVRALTVSGAWRGTARDARAAWGGGKENKQHSRASVV